MKVTKCSLEGILLIEPGIYGDDRGFFLESFERERYRALGITEEFVQDNHSRSARNVLTSIPFEIIWVIPCPRW